MLRGPQQHKAVARAWHRVAGQLKAMQVPYADENVLD